METWFSLISPMTGFTSGMLHPGDYQLYRIASGGSDDDYQRTEILMKELPTGMFDAFGLYHYSVIDWNKKGPATSFSEEQYFTTMKRALQIEEFCKAGQNKIDNLHRR